MNTTTIDGLAWSQSSDIFGARAEAEGWGFKLRIFTVLGCCDDEHPYGWSITRLSDYEEVDDGSARTARDAARQAVAAARRNQRRTA